MIEDQVSNFEARNTMNLLCTLTFYSKNYRSMRLVCFRVNEACTLKPKIFANGLFVKSPFETCFLEVKAKMYVRYM